MLLKLSAIRKYELLMISIIAAVVEVTYFSVRFSAL